ncbi:MAG: VWA domain-containing protein [Lachnospiraceae bacterium]|nr:VWA domain-containing protein [Lachnospiraceae bacterium]
MKKRTKIITALLLILALAVMMFAGCSKNTEESDSGDPSSTGTEATVDVSPAGTLTGSAADKGKGELTKDVEKTPSSTPAPGEADISTTTDGKALEKKDTSSFDMGDVEEPAAVVAPEAYMVADDGLPLERFAGGPEDGEVFMDAIEGGVFEGAAKYDDALAPTQFNGDPGTLTAGEWNDNKNYDFFRQMLNKTIEKKFEDPEEDDSLRKGEPVDPIDPVVPDFPDLPTEDGLEADDVRGNQGGQGAAERVYADLFKEWELTPFKRLAMHVTDGSGADVCNASCTVLTADGKELVTVRTDRKGMAYAFYDLFGSSSIPAKVSVKASGAQAEYDVASADLLDDAVAQIKLDGGAAAVSGTSLDLMFVIDTTGSMGDEIQYLQVELEDVINRVKEAHKGMPVRLSVNFYRDVEDNYVVRSYPFGSDIEEQLSYLRVEYADGGGDYEEAVELALADGIDGHGWDEDSVKLMFMVLDAPPHNTDTVRKSLASSIEKGMAKGVRIVPVASSGVDKSTEMLLRTFAMTTGGTYTFLTDDSGVGDSHIEPTIGDYEVEKLNDLLVRVIGEYLA